MYFLHAGVASGKSTLAQYLCQQQPSKYLQVYHSAFDSLTFQHWQTKFKAALEKEPSAPDVAKGLSLLLSVVIFIYCALLVWGRFLFSCFVLVVLFWVWNG